jgi:glycosyltransferase involved in cell wall biosynthesis
MDLSIIIPVYNEADNLRPLCQRIHDTLSSTGWTYEVVIGNDGSGETRLLDKGRARIENSGQQSALSSQPDEANEI